MRDGAEGESITVDQGGYVAAIRWRIVQRLRGGDILGRRYGRGLLRIRGRAMQAAGPVAAGVWQHFGG